MEETTVVGEMPTGPVLLPNGFIVGEGENEKWIRYVELREMTGVEEDLLVDKQAQREGTWVGRLFRAVITGYLDENRTSIPFEAKMAEQIPLADMTMLFVRLRQMSLDDGNTISYRHRCPYESCKKEKPTQYVVNLAEQPCVWRSKEERPKRTYSVPYGPSKPEVSVSFRTLVIGDYISVLEAQRESPDKVISNQLIRCIQSVGADPVDDGEKGMAIVRGLPSRPRKAIRDFLDTDDRGIDNTVINTCPKCKGEFTTPLPIGDVSFFGLSGKPQQSKPTSTSSGKSGV